MIKVLAPLPLAAGLVTIPSTAYAYNDSQCATPTEYSNIHLGDTFRRVKDVMGNDPLVMFRDYPDSPFYAYYDSCGPNDDVVELKFDGGDIHKLTYKKWVNIN